MFIILAWTFSSLTCTSSKLLIFFSGRKIPDASKTAIGFGLVLVISFTKILAEIAKSVQLLLLFDGMVFHQMTLWSHTHPKVSFVRQNLVTEPFAFN
jgi:hypothetical protein